MKLKKIIYLLFVTVVFTACNDIEEEIYSSYSASNYYENEDQLQTQAMGMYDTYSHTLWGQDTYSLISGPSKYYASRSPATVYVNSAIYATNELPLSQHRYNRLWNMAYQCIGRANTIIKTVPSSPFAASEPDIAAEYVAEARWMRAYNYFQLVQLFGDVPLYTSPVETSDPEVLFRARTPLAEVYDVIIEDLIFAQDNLPVTWANTGRGRATKSSGAFLLGKVYLTSAGLPMQITENYQKAIDVLKPLADNPGDYDVELLQNWADVFSMSNEGNKEIIFGLGNIYENLSGGVLSFFTTPFGSNLGGLASAAGGGGLYTWDPRFLDTFEANDVRLDDGFVYSFTRANNGQTVTYDPSFAPPITPQLYKGYNGIASTKYIDSGSSSNVAHSKDHIIYRYAEVFLMLAEAYNENGSPSAALPYLQTTRDRVNASVITTTDQNTLRDIIRAERLRELYGEMTEVYDFRRWGTAEQEFNESFIRIRLAPDRVWDEKFLRYPIPSEQLAANPNLVPNW